MVAMSSSRPSSTEEGTEEESLAAGEAKPVSRLAKEEGRGEGEAVADTAMQQRIGERRQGSSDLWGFDRSRFREW